MRFRESFQRIAASPLADTFLLQSLERTVSAYPEHRIDKMQAFFRAADRRARAADELFEAQAAVSFPLYREAALLYLAAALSIRPDVVLEEPLRGEDIVARFRQVEPKQPCPRLGKELDYFLGLIVAHDPMALDRVSPEEASDRTKSIRVIVGWMRELTEPRTVREIKARRRLRVGVLLVLVLGSLLWAVIALASPKNIALHKPVIASSIYPGATSQPSGLTDGVTHGSYGLATDTEQNPSVTVDLLDIYRIDKIKIYNRGDGWYDYSLPLRLEFSQDGTDYEEVDTRTVTFGQWTPWTYAAGRKRARFIRLRGSPGKAITLSELEAFGKK